MDWRFYLRMKTIVGIVLLFFMSQLSGHAQLIRDRSVQCNSNEMLVTFEFTQPFNGVVYASKFYQTIGCKWEGNGSRRLQAPIPLTTNPTAQPYCGVQLKEASGEFTVTVFISPMKGLLVEGMDMLVIRCLYTIGDVTLTLSPGTNGAGIQISPHTQGSVVTGSGGNPFLQMAIRDGHGINNDVIQVANVGQRITLDVVMRDTTIYDFYVHDCYAHDGTNTPEASVSIIDQNGCAVRLSRAVDVPVFTTAPVPNGAKHVYVHMYGFQFTTSQFVYFECQVRPCLQSCNRPQCITGAASSPPPSTKLVSIRSRRAAMAIRSDSKGVKFDSEIGVTSATPYSQDNYNLTTVIRIEPQELVAFTPGAASLSRDASLQSPNGFNDIQSPKRVSSPNSSAEVCVNTSVAVALLVIFILVCLVSLSIAILVCHRAHKDSLDDDELAKGDLQCGSSSASTTTTIEEVVVPKPRKRLLPRQTSVPTPAVNDYYSSIVSSTQPTKKSGNRQSNIEQSPYAAIGQ